MILLVDPHNMKNTSNARLASVCILSALITLSDTFFVFIFIIPFTAYLLYLLYIHKNNSSDDLKNKMRKKKMHKGKIRKEKEENHQKNWKEVSFIFFLMFSSIVAWSIKKYIGPESTTWPGFIGTKTSLVNFDVIVNNNLPLLIKSFALLINNHLFDIVTGNLNVLGLLISGLLLFVIVYSIVFPDKKNRYVYAIFLLSTIIVCSGYVFLNWAIDLNSARYLSFIIIAVFATIALAYRDDDTFTINKNTLCAIAIALLLLSTIPVNYRNLLSLDHQPNKEDYAFISYLREKKVTDGYADYWTANKLTYLSKGEINLRPFMIYNGGFLPDPWLSARRWFNDTAIHLLIMKEGFSDFNKADYNRTVDIMKNFPEYEVSHTMGYRLYILPEI